MKKQFSFAKQILKKPIFLALGAISFLPLAVSNPKDFYCTKTDCYKTDHYGSLNESEPLINPSIVTLLIMGFFTTVVGLCKLCSYIVEKYQQLTNDICEKRILSVAQKVMGQYEPIKEIVISDHNSLRQVLNNNFPASTSFKVKIDELDTNTLKDMKLLLSKQLPIKTFTVESFANNRVKGQLDCITSIVKNKNYNSLICFSKFENKALLQIHEKSEENLEKANQYADMIMDIVFKNDFSIFENGSFDKDLKGREHAVIDRIKVKLMSNHGFTSEAADVTSKYCYKKILDIKPFIRNGIVKKSLQIEDVKMPTIASLPNDVIGIISSYAFPPLLTFTKRIQQESNQNFIKR